jgi:NitT/TauT family transport system permease protein
MISILKVYSFATLLVLWFLLSAVLSPSVVPGPVAVGGAVLENLRTGEPWTHISITVLRVTLGLALAMLLGLGVGLVMGLSRRGELFFDSWVMIGLTVPAIVYGMMCLLWFGLNNFAAVIAIGITAFPAVGINLWQGVKDMDLRLVGMGKAFRLPRHAIIWKIIVPQLVPYLLGSSRYALGICWKICTTIELIGLSSGVGFMLNYWFSLFSMTQVFAWTFMFLIVMLAIEFILFRPIEKRLTLWRPAAAASLRF